MPVQLRKEDFSAFFQAPFDCYGEDARIASPLRQDLKRTLDVRRNPLFRDFARRTWFTAHRDGHVVGRIVAHIHDASNRLYGQRQGHFGMFDCIDDVEVAQTLMDAACDWLRARDCDEVVGSFNLSITQMIGVVTDGFEHPPYTYQDWSPPHLPRLLEGMGFTRCYPMRTFEIPVDGVLLDSLMGERQQVLLRDSRWRFEPITRRNLRQKLLESRVVLNDGFADNPMFVPLSEDEFLFPAEGMSLILDETLSWMAYHDDRPVGALLCIPDLNPFLHATRYRYRWNTPWLLWRHRRHRDRASMLFYSVCRDHHGSGVNGVLLHRTITALRAGGYRRFGGSWISDGNAASLRQVEKLNGRPLHRLHLFRRAL